MLNRQATSGQQNEPISMIHKTFPDRLLTRGKTNTGNFF